MAVRPNNTLDKVRALQHKLYRTAKQSPNRRFHVLYDRVHRRDVLRRAWLEVRANQGAPGIDAITIADIEAAGVEEFLDDLEASLHEWTYRPQPLRRVWIPKPGKPDKLRECFRDRERAGPGGPASAEDRHRADLRGGLSALLVRVSAPARRPSSTASNAGGNSGRKDMGGGCRHRELL